MHIKHKKINNKQKKFPGEKNLAYQTTTLWVSMENNRSLFCFVLCQSSPKLHHLIRANGKNHSAWI